MRPTLFLFACLLASSTLFGAPEVLTVKSGAEPGATAWPVPDSAAVRMELEHWLGADRLATPQAREEILALWNDATTPERTLPGNMLYERTVESLRRASTHVGEYLAACDALAWQELPFAQPLVLPQIPLQVYLSESGSTGFLTAALRYYLARRLVQARLYDEAGPILDEMTSENSLDPTGVLLDRAIVGYHLADSAKTQAALKAFDASTEQDPAVPRRRTELARLLRFEQEKNRSQEDAQNISRKMDDIRRRLGKGKTDDDTQQAEDDVMKSLDRLIEKIEQQAKQAGESECQEGRNSSNNPADDSRIGKLKAPGHVDRRDFDLEGRWGDLPPKEREEALMRIEKEFPAHYRDIIEQYFREMAGNR